MKDNKKIFIAGYTTLSATEKKIADKKISELKKQGYKIEMGI